MPVSSAVADPYTTTAEGDPQEGSVSAEYEALVAVLLALLVAYLAPKPGVPVPEWAARVAARLPRFRTDVLRRVARTASRVEAEAARGMRAVTDTAAAAAARDTRWRGPLPDVAEAQVRGLVEVLQAAHPRVVAVVEETYQRAVYAARAASGDPTVAVQRVLDDFAGRGVTGFVDRSGRRWNLETWVETTVRSHYADAALAAYLEVARRAGGRFVRVSFSPAPCPRCLPWQGTVLSVDGSPAGTYMVGGREVTVAGTLDEARAAGLLHPWCRHRVAAIVPGRSLRMAPGRLTAAVKAARAEARYRRRTARAWERRQTVALTTRARVSAESRVSRWRNNRRDR